MRKNSWSIARITALAGVVLLSTSAMVFGARSTWQGVWEGEQFTKTTGAAFQVMKYTKDITGAVSGKQVIGIEKVPRGEKVPTGTVSYTVTIPADGTYYFWARSLWSNGCGNSVLVQVPGIKGNLLIGGDGTYDSMKWRTIMDGSRPKPLKLQKGPATFTLVAKESGVKVDQFLLTTDRGCTPAGTYTATSKLVASK